MTQVHIRKPVTAKLYPYDFEIYKKQDKLWLYG